ncbi:MAG TPA: ABC transporter ATP-binding protein [Burkholderiaceae bacterium]|nr:ABC transporter ATP-binding protein [Burkholderiaceae bacterium]
MSQPSAFVSIESLHFGYEGRPLLHDVSLRVPRGEVVALMGGSGSGKTTLLRLLGGQLRPDAGRVRFDGQDVSTLGRDALYAMRRRMGMLFQFGALFTDLTVFDNVAFPLREHTALPEETIRDLVLMKLDAVGLRGAASLMPSQVSGGMARRVALARAIALDPPLLMYDEPFAGLDPISLGTIAHLIRSLNDALGATSIVVTHDVAETFAIADRVHLLGAGRIVASGTPAELRASGDPYVRQFLDGARDGPVQFHRQAPPIAEQLGLRP